MELPTDRPDYSKYVIDPETGEEVQVHDEYGRELPDQVPMAPPLGYSKPLSMFDQMRSQIRAEHHRLQMLALEELQETADEANDFEIDEDVENMPSLYEEKFDPVDIEVRTRLRQAEFRAKFDAAVDVLPPHQKELLNGESLSRSDQGRDRSAGPVSGHSNPVVKGKSKSQSKSKDQGSVSVGDSDSGEVEE